MQRQLAPVTPCIASSEPHALLRSYLTSMCFALAAFWTRFAYALAVLLDSSEEAATSVLQNFVSLLERKTPQVDHAPHRK